MARAKRSTRANAQRNPVGVVHIAAGGYGFVDTPEGEFFVPANKMGGAFDGDTVEVRPVNVNPERPQPGKRHNAVGKNPTARVVGIVNRAHQTIVGRYEVAEPFGVVVPSDDRIRHDIFTMHAENPGVRDGDMVLVRILQYPGPRTAATGVVEEVIGHADARGVDIDALVASYNLRTSFDAEALAEAGEAKVDAEGALAAGYRDLRDRCVFTVDPEDARDYDDALSLEQLGEHWRLGVHIADVSFYVRPSSALDAEARLRATSVYLADRVLPMIPEALSNGVCSLAPGEDRRCITVDIELDADARVLGAEYYPAIIRSSARLSYDQVQELFEGGECMIDEQVRERLLGLRSFARAFKAQRRRAGALDLSSAEAHVVLDGDGVPERIATRRSTEATELVESFMVLANSLVAKHLLRRGEPALYRVHEAPDADSMAHLVPLLREYGYSRLVDTGSFAAGDPHAVQRVIDLASERGEGELVSMLLLRSLKRARYSAECLPHFGLALDEYLHFTSPIRRYPDLVAHRALKRCMGIAGIGGEGASNALPMLAEHASAMERIADEAARRSQQMKLVEYLGGFVGEVFEGRICKVATYGFFVRLDNTATGLVPLGRDSIEPFRLDVRRQALVGQHTGKTFRLGQVVKVRLVAARPQSRELDFELY